MPQPASPTASHRGAQFLVRAGLTAYKSRRADAIGRSSPAPSESRGHLQGGGRYVCSLTPNLPANPRRRTSRGLRTPLPRHFRPASPAICAFNARMVHLPRGTHTFYARQHPARPSCGPRFRPLPQPSLRVRSPNSPCSRRLACRPYARGTQKFRMGPIYYPGGHVGPSPDPLRPPGARLRIRRV